jgi:hypothetical protein
MSNDVASPTSVPDGVDALKKFQLTTEGIKDKSSRAYGLAISKYIAATTSFNSAGYYFNRNARFIKNRNYANGQLDIKAMFQDRFKFNSKQNYIALNWQALQIVNRIISGLVGRWMTRNEKVQVKAIDNLSQTQKQDQYNEIEYILENRRRIEELQEKSGVQLIPENDFLPADKEELNLWQAQFQRLSEEILYELGCNDVLTSNGVFDVIKEKMLHDIAETGFCGTYTWMDSEGVIHVRRVKPENAIYSWSEYDDFRDSSWLGEAPTIKISEIRREYGKEFNPDNPFALTEKEIWDKVVPQAKEYQYQSNIGWNDIYINAFLRPYDEWNVRSIQYELRTVDSEPYTVTKTRTNSTYTQKGLPVTKTGKAKEKPSENQNIIGDSNWNIYRGVYLPDCDILIKWSLKDNMIRSQDPKEIGNSEFSYSYYMFQNYMMRNLAIPQKIEAAVDGMILALLKMQQIMARLVPSGWAIDETALQNIDYGVGDANEPIDHAKVYFQTGLLYYRGLDADGTTRIPPPIQEIANNGFVGQMQGLIANYQFNYQTLKDELGEDPNLITAALQPRVTAGNVEASQESSAYATDYNYRAYAECIKMTSRKISCLLKDSVTYGSAAYQKLVKKEDVDRRQFSTDIRFLPTQQDLARFDAMMNQTIAANPELLSFLDPFQLLRVAKEDVKLAELMFRQAQKKLILFQRQSAMENQQQTIEGQIKSAQMAEEEKRATEQLKIDGDIKKTQITGEAQNRTSVINMVTAWLTPNADGTIGKVPPEYQPLVNAVVQNIMVGAVAATEEQKQQIVAQMQQAQMEQEQQQMAEQEQMMQQGQQMDQSQPQQQAAA